MKNLFLLFFIGSYVFAKKIQQSDKDKPNKDSNSNRKTDEAPNKNINDESKEENKKKLKEVEEIVIQKCSYRCLECQNNNCLKCENSYFLYNTICNFTCPPGTFADGHVCTPCDFSCPVCWSGDKNQCGLIKGKNALIVKLQDEMKKILIATNLSNSERSKILSSLNIILKEEMEEKPLLSTGEIYQNAFQSKTIDLPIFSFSEFNGIFFFIPPSNESKSHWKFKEGMWDGKAWKEWTPKLPLFIKLYGDKEKIYYENQGYWYNENNFWKRIEGKKLSNRKGTSENINYLLANLNSIKINVIFSNS